jgi:hypothetical protein
MARKFSELIERMTPKRRARVAARVQQAALAHVDGSVRLDGCAEPKLQPKQVGLNATRFVPEDEEQAGD